MILYLQAKTTATDLMIDYIEVSLKDGTTVSLNWDESYIDRDDTGLNATYKGVCFNEEHADGRIDELREMQVIDVGLYSEVQAPATIFITEMEFVDGDKRIRFTTPYPKAEDAKIETEERSITMLTASEKIKLWNNAEKRRSFINDYLNWDEWIRVEPLGLVFYKYELTDEVWFLAMAFHSMYRQNGVYFYIHDPNKPFQPYSCNEYTLENELKNEKMRLQKELKKDAEANRKVMTDSAPSKPGATEDTGGNENG